MGIINAINRNSINVGGIVHYLQPNQTLKILFHQSTAGTPQSVTDTSTNADYVVTTGKTYTNVGLIHYQTTAYGTSNLIYQANTADAITLLKLTYAVQPSIMAEFPFAFTIASDKYITCDPSGALTYYVIMLGYEQ